jgi:hypothetical protein
VGPHSRSGLCGEKKILLLPRIEHPIPTEMSRLSTKLSICFTVFTVLHGWLHSRMDLEYRSTKKCVTKLRTYVHSAFKTKSTQVGFEVPIAVATNNITSWNVTPCSPTQVHRRPGGT